MTFRVSLLFQADAKAAKAEVDGLATSARKVGEAAQDMGRKATDGARGVDSIARSADGAEAQLQGLTAAQQTNAASTTQLANSHRLAAGATGNLVAQFNDIGMMLAAGQNPLQLAIQQGTQISQVIGPMGAAGAAKALGTAFIGMLSPINLITIGSIAAGAAIIQWLMGAGEQAANFEDRIKDLEQAVSAYRAAAELAGASTDELTERFQGAAGEAGRIAGVLRELENIEALRALDSAVADLTVRFGGLSDSLISTRDGAIQEIDVTMFRLQTTLQLTETQAAFVVDALRDLAQAPDVSSQVDAAIALNERFIEVFGSVQAIPPELQDVARQASIIALSAAEISGEMDAATISVQGLSGASQVVAGYLYDAQTALGLLAAMEPDAGWLNGAINAASILAGNLWNAVSAQSTLGAMGPMGGARPSGEGRGSAGGAPVAPEPPGRPQVRPIDIDFGYTPPVAAAGGGGAARVERDAVQELIEKLQEEVAILRETDPVQQELLRHRETMAEATDAERAEVEALITARERERTSAEAVAESWDMMESSSYDALRAIALQGESATDVLRNLGVQLAEVLFQAAIMGEGPLGGLFGGTSIFSLMGAALGVPAKAKGGMIHGPGDGTSDDVLMYGSSGEFVVTADATSRYRPVLEAMNAGAPLPSFAKGGMIGGGARAGGAGGSDPRPMHVTMDVRGARGDREIEEASYRGMQRALAEYDRSVLPDSIARVSRDPLRRGG
jgi:hypothetical protein